MAFLHFESVMHSEMPEDKLKPPFFHYHFHYHFIFHFHFIYHVYRYTSRI